jgi:DNA-binding transcriptional regulator GbsR (MarR family)
MDNLNETLDSVGEFIEYWGFKHIHGRIWALIYLSEEPISTPYIVKTLGVSKGLVSIAINELLEHELISEAGKVKNGALTYTSREDAAKTVRRVLRNRELVMVSKAEQQLNLINANSKSELKKQNISKEKLFDLLDLTSVSKSILLKMTSENLGTIYSWTAYFKKLVKVF